jgi:hypothetical protein
MVLISLGEPIASCAGPGRKFTIRADFFYSSYAPDMSLTLLREAGFGIILCKKIDKT